MPLVLSSVHEPRAVVDMRLRRRLGVNCSTKTLSLRKLKKVDKRVHFNLWAVGGITSS